MKLENILKDSKGAGSIEAAIGIVIGVVVFTALLPVAFTALESLNITGTAGTLVDMIPLFLVLGVVLSIIAWAIKPVRSSAGGLGNAIRTKAQTIYDNAATNWQMAQMSAKGAIDVDGMIGAIIVVTVGLLLFPVVNTQINTIGVENSATENIGDAAASLVDMIPLFYAMAILFLGIGWALRAVKNV